MDWPEVSEPLVSILNGTSEDPQLHDFALELSGEEPWIADYWEGVQAIRRDDLRSAVDSWIGCLDLIGLAPATVISCAGTEICQYLERIARTDIRDEPDISPLGDLVEGIIERNLRGDSIIMHRMIVNDHINRIDDHAGTALACREVYILCLVMMQYMRIAPTILYQASLSGTIVQFIEVAVGKDGFGEQPGLAGAFAFYTDLDDAIEEAGIPDVDDMLAATVGWRLHGFSEMYSELRSLLDGYMRGLIPRDEGKGRISAYVSRFNSMHEEEKPGMSCFGCRRWSPCGDGGEWRCRYCGCTTSEDDLEAMSYRVRGAIARCDPQELRRILHWHGETMPAGSPIFLMAHICTLEGDFSTALEITAKTIARGEFNEPLLSDMRDALISVIRHFGGKGLRVTTYDAIAFREAMGPMGSAFMEDMVSIAVDPTLGSDPGLAAFATKLAAGAVLGSPDVNRAVLEAEKAASIMREEASDISPSVLETETLVLKLIGRNIAALNGAHRDGVVETSLIDRAADEALRGTEARELCTELVGAAFGRGVEPPRE